MQKLMNLPFAYQTIGSAMAVRAFAYAKEGGMVNRQAGEDFYFLHKYTKNRSLGEIKSTIVYPSDRTSSRVPFGTGKAVNTILNSSEEYKTYHYNCFKDLELFFKLLFKVTFTQISDIQLIYRELNESLAKFLIEQNFEKHLNESILNTSSQQNFEKRIFYWFDAFKLMKYLHFMREHEYGDIPIDDAIEYLFTELDLSLEAKNQKEKLLKLRAYDLMH